MGRGNYKDLNIRGVEKNIIFSDYAPNFFKLKISYLRYKKFAKNPSNIFNTKNEKAHGIIIHQHVNSLFLVSAVKKSNKKCVRK